MNKLQIYHMQTLKIQSRSIFKSFDSIIVKDEENIKLF